MRLGDALANAAVAIAMETLGRRAFNRVVAAADDPGAAQRCTLRAILQACRQTEQARRFGLDGVDDVEAFRKAVPIQSYEDLRPALERQIATGALEIAPEPPIMYARSSGTTGAAKYVPVTAHVLSQLRGAQRAMAFAQYRALGAFSGRIVGLGGARCEEVLAGGVPAGATTGLIFETMPRFMRAKYLIPPAVFAIDDYELKYALIARLAIQAGDVSAFATANPSTLLRLMDVVRRNLAEMVEEIGAGEARTATQLEATLAEAIRPSLVPDPRRAEAIRPLVERVDSVTIADLWPGLRMIVTWLGGGCALAAEAVRAQLPAGARMVDAGYVASEVRGTIVVDVARGLALPLLEDVFFEFVPVEAWDAGERSTTLLHQLREGHDYHVIVTTAAGLLRYHMNDVVRATSRVGNTPTLAFLRKGRGVTNITGEKLTEDQVHLAMTATTAELGVASTFFVVLADGTRSGYCAFAELRGSPVDPDAFAAALDRKLCELNIEYAAKRESGRLQAIEVRALRTGAADAYHRHCVEGKKQREAQAKVQALQTAEECDFDFEAHGVADARLAPSIR